MPMERADRKTINDDRAAQYPQGHRTEPITSSESKQLLMTLRVQKNELQEKLKHAEDESAQTHQRYLEEQQKYQSALTLYQGEQQKYNTTLALYEEEQQRYQSTLTLYQEEQHRYQSTLTLYQQEKVSNGELWSQIHTLTTERDEYIVLYNQAQSDLKFERRSKAGIKSWETRRKRENERLKQEIGEMTVILRDSIVRRDDAIGNLEALTTRMDRIQNLVDSVEDNSTESPVSLIQKFRRIWQTIQDILAE